MCLLNFIVLGDEKNLKLRFVFCSLLKLVGILILLIFNFEFFFFCDVVNCKFMFLLLYFLYLIVLEKNEFCCLRIGI